MDPQLLHHPPPNAALTAEEREARIHLKKLFREQQIRSKLTLRLFKAESRNEVTLAEETRRALHEFDARAHPATTAPHHPYACCHWRREDDRDPQEILAGTCIEQIYQTMQKTWRDVNETDTTTTATSSMQHPRARKNHANPQYTPRHVKERRLVESQRLLQHMSKGIQTLSEFQNPEALRGYTRQKFMERANLVVRSLVRLHQSVLNPPPLSELDSSSSSSADIHQAMLERLWQVRSVCSVGCGPGGETVGVVAFLQSHHQQLTAAKAAAGTSTTGHHHDTEHDNQDGHFVLDRIVFCDWALSDWRPMLESVKECLVEQQQSVKRVDMATCDVRVPLWDSATNAGELSTQGSDNNLPGKSTVAKSFDSHLLRALFPSISSSNSHLPQHQLVVISFLLSETRGQWHMFFDDLVDAAPEGTLFLLTDPTAWQLHLFRQRYEFFDRPHHPKRRRMHFCWLDSSMYRPELQVLSARLSSAVLMGIVVSTFAKHGD